MFKSAKNIDIIGDKMCDFFELSGCELVALASILAISISQGLSPDEINTLGNFFSALGSNLSTIASAKAGEEINNEKL